MTVLIAASTDCFLLEYLICCRLGVNRAQSVIYMFAVIGLLTCLIFPSTPIPRDLLARPSWLGEIGITHFTNSFGHKSQHAQSAHAYIKDRFSGLICPVLIMLFTCMSDLLVCTERKQVPHLNCTNQV